jgi:excisionase family DNA binding protein
MLDKDLSCKILSKKTRVSKVLRVGEAAKLLGVTATTLRRWDKSGKLKSKRNMLTGHRYYDREDLKVFMVKNAKYI